jgi:hypothetical protein
MGLPIQEQRLKVVLKLEPAFSNAVQVPEAFLKVPKRSGFVLFALVSLSLQMIDQATICVDLPVPLVGIGIRPRDPIDGQPKSCPVRLFIARKRRGTGAGSKENEQKQQRVKPHSHGLPPSFSRHDLSPMPNIPE